jgi:hypothetical protein
MKFKNVRFTDGFTEFNPNHAKPFKLDQALNKVPVMMRGGHRVRDIVRVAGVSNSRFEVRGRVAETTEYTFTTNGKFDLGPTPHSHDLFMAPVFYIGHSPVYYGDTIMLRKENTAWSTLTVTESEDTDMRAQMEDTEGLRYKLWDEKLVGKMPKKKECKCGLYNISQQ